MGGGCPFSGIGFSLLAAVAGFSSLFLNGKKIFRKALTYSESLPRGVERDSSGQLWFRELSEFWKGQAMCLEVDRIVYSGHTGMQDILVFENSRFGTVLVLDGAIQVTTLDEVAYQEVMAHTPMHLVKEGSVRKALVIGGGDGGVLRELAKYPEIEEIHICEIDGGVIDVCKKFMPSTSVGFRDPRVQVHIEDGFLFLERIVKEGIRFDVIVSDLSDPIGPAESIFNGSFIELLSKVLNPDHGVAALQGECVWLHAELIRKLVKESQAAFAQVKYASIGIPTYPCGQIGCLVMCKNKDVSPQTVLRRNGIEESQLKFYSEELHAAQFVLPKIVGDLVYRS
jgi:spermidine synthase